MSTQGDQPNPYAQRPQPHDSPPQQPHPYIPPPQQSQPQVPPQVPPGPQPSVPQQGGPYLQHPYGYGPPQEAGAFGPPMPSVSAPPGGSRLRGWRWGLGGAVAASAVWTATLFAAGGLGSGDSPDLGGYIYRSDVCASTDFAAFEEEYPQEREPPESDGAKHPNIDAMWCTVSLAPTGAEYSSARVSIEVWLYKKTDPAANFAAVYESFDQRGGMNEGYQVRKVPGIGDVAYLVVPQEPNASGSAAYLAVRDGWMTYQMSWNNYVSRSDTGVTEPGLSKVEEMLKKDTEATLEKLRS